MNITNYHSFIVTIFVAIFVAVLMLAQGCDKLKAGRRECKQMDAGKWREAYNHDVHNCPIENDTGVLILPKKTA